MKKFKSFIKHINWCKDFDIPFCGNKGIYLQIIYSGWHCFNFKYRINRMDHAGFDFDLELLGIDFRFEFYDGCHYNRMEKRFYLDDEPEYWGNKKKFLSEVKEFIKRHPEIDAGYYGRCLEEIAFQKEAQECPPPKKDYKKAVINWKEVYKGGWSYKSKYVYYKCLFKINEKNKKQIIRIGFMEYEIMDKKRALLWLDLYDKKGNLISRSEDYQ